MKKIKLLLITLIALIPISAKANSVHCSAPGSVESGETFSVRFYGSLSGAGGIWFGSIGSDGNATYQGGSLSFGGEETQDFSRTITYKAGNPGTARFYAYDVDAASDVDEISTSDSCTVTIVQATPAQGNSGGGSSYNYYTDDRSSNNNLRNITIEGVTLTPEFNADNLEYKATVEGKVEKVNIQAELDDDRASVDGLGEKELIEGVNRFELHVRAENEEEKVYVVEITRKEKNPIEVTINKKKYTVFKKEANIEPPKGFVKTNVVIEKQDVVAYSNKYIDYILVLLVDEEGNSDFYIYNSKNSTYIKYNEVEAKDSRLVIIKANKKDIPLNYKKTTIKINKETVEAYYLKGNSDFKLVYAINMNNGKEAFYQYDVKEKTFQRYNNKLVSSVEEFSKKLEVGLVAAGALILILFLLLISQASSKRKMKKVLKNRKETEAIEKIAKKEEKKELPKEEKKETPKEEKKEIPKEEKKEEPKKEEVKEEKKELSKKELKKLQKEEKKKLKKQQEDFLK